MIGNAAALGCAGLLLLPGGRFLLVGLVQGDMGDIKIGIGIVIVVGVLFWLSGWLADRLSGPGS